MSPDAALPQPPSIGAGALLRWLLRRAAVPVTLATLAACTSNIIQAIVPAFLGQALDAGIENGLNGRVWGIGALLLVLFVVYAVGDTMLSYFGVTAWMRTAFDVDRLVGRQVSATGKDLSRQVSTGEVATIIASDADYLGKLIQHLPALLGAAASFLVVAVLMLRTSVSLGLIVILGMPLVAAIVTLVIRPLQKRQAVQREAQSAVTTITTDTVAGLRILRGIGGEDVFARRYRDASQELRRRGVEVASSQATLMTLQVLLPGLFAAIVVWVAARMAVAGSLTPGGLITFYGYTAYLSWPLWVFTSSVQDYTRAVVGARRLSRLLEVAPAAGSLVERLNLDPAAAHPVSGDLVDTDSGLRLEEGRMTALVCPDPQVSAELATRLGRFTDAGPTVTLAGRPLTTMPLEQVRASVVVSGATAQLFTGTLREALDVRGGPDPQPAGLEDLVRAETERTTGADVDQQVRAQERDMRAGTENTAGIVACGRAAEIACAEQTAEEERLRAYTELLRERIGKIRRISFHGDRDNRLAGILNFGIAGIAQDTLLIRLDLAGFAVSAGSACSAGAAQVSHVLRAMGCSEDVARTCIRVSLGRHTTREDVLSFAETLAAIAEELQ